MLSGSFHEYPILNLEKTQYFLLLHYSNHFYLQNIYLQLMCMNIFNRYMTLYVNWISLLCPDITHCLYHHGNADWIMCKVHIDTVSNKISCRHKLIYNISLTRDQSGLKNRSVIPSEHGFCLLNVQLSNFSRQGSIYLGTVHCLRHNLLLEWYFWGFCFAK